MEYDGLSIKVVEGTGCRGTSPLSALKNIRGTVSLQYGHTNKNMVSSLQLGRHWNIASFFKTFVNKFSPLEHAFLICWIIKGWFRTQFFFFLF